MRFLFSFFSFAFVFMTFSTAHACYGRLEAEAEQGLRIHSEIMVIGLNCQNVALTQHQNLYYKYQQFSNAHAALIEQYENILMNHYARNGYPNPERSLHSLRTTLANHVSDVAAESRPDVFCSHYADRVIRASQMSENDFRSWAQQIYPNHPLHERTCF